MHASIQTFTTVGLICQLKHIVRNHNGHQKQHPACKNSVPLI